jgi:hypothetical protein
LDECEVASQVVVADEVVAVDDQWQAVVEESVAQHATLETRQGRRGHLGQRAVTPSVVGETVTHAWNEAWPMMINDRRTFIITSLYLTTRNSQSFIIYYFQRLRQESNIIWAVVHHTKRASAILVAK